jgi:hypothetical protein
MKVCGQNCEVYSRIVGYYRPLETWNTAQRAQFRNRVNFDADKAVEKIKGEKKKGKRKKRKKKDKDTCDHSKNKKFWG